MRTTGPDGQPCPAPRSLGSISASLSSRPRCSALCSACSHIWVWPPVTQTHGRQALCPPRAWSWPAPWPLQTLSSMTLSSDHPPGTGSSSSCLHRPSRQRAFPPPNYGVVFDVNHPSVGGEPPPDQVEPGKQCSTRELEQCPGVHCDHVPLPACLHLPSPHWPAIPNHKDSPACTAWKGQGHPGPSTWTLDDLTLNR